ncbi:Hypothetical predicted protein [Olea europaea subsp. europaea]|uniref:Uncharacterized protein n=1 Tax=Olea europaea subsp. europaea TaxID=158383 RepID=A0A8S0TA25_OLEEU|nr:Hypothetical predicted protein [Olea europaea subsp. europaea]
MHRQNHRVQLMLQKGLSLPLPPACGWCHCLDLPWSRGFSWYLNPTPPVHQLYQVF